MWGKNNQNLSFSEWVIKIIYLKIF